MDRRHDLEVTLRSRTPIIVIETSDESRILQMLQSNNGQAVDYGYGWDIESYGDNLLWVGHSGGWAGTATYISRCVDDDLSVVVLSNDENAPVATIGDKMAELFDE